MNCTRLFTCVVIVLLAAGAVSAQQADKDSVRAPKTNSSRIIQVYDPDTQEGIEGVRVLDKVTGNSVKTTTTGHVVLVPEFVKRSGALLIFLKIGYDTVGPILVDPQSDTLLQIPMSKLSAQELPAVVTTAKAVVSAAEERAKSYGGKVLVTDDLPLEQKNLPIGKVLERKGMTPEFTVTHRASKGFKNAGDGDCKPRILLNGDETAGSLLDLNNDPASSFTAVEFYPTAARAPKQFLKNWSTSCGVIILWSVKPQ